MGKPNLNNVCPYCFAAASLKGYQSRLLPPPIKGEICENCGKRYWRDEYRRTLKFEDAVIIWILGVIIFSALAYMILTKTSC